MSNSNPPVSPYLGTPQTYGGRPKMFNSTAAQVIWVLAPIITVGIGAAVPFVVAAVKGVIKPWVAVLYTVVEVGLFTLVTALTPSGEEASPFYGLALVLLIVTAATHTGLLDNERVTVGK